MKTHTGRDDDDFDCGSASFNNYEQSYRLILAGLSPPQRAAVHRAVIGSMIEDDIPALKFKSVERLADLAAGRISGDEYRAEILAGLAAKADPDQCHPQK